MNVSSWIRPVLKPTMSDRYLQLNIYDISVYLINNRAMNEYFGLDELLYSANTHPIASNNLMPDLGGAIIPDCLNSLSYPSCPLSHHECEPLSSVCVDEKCTNRSLICALCQNEHHYKHACVPLKMYLNQVYGHLLVPSNEETSTMSSQKQRGRRKNKSRSKPTAPSQNMPIPETNRNVLFYTQNLESQKSEFIELITCYRDNLIEQLHSLETLSIKFFNQRIQQASMLVAMANPVPNIQKMTTNLKNYQHMRQAALDTCEMSKYDQLLSSESTRLKEYVKRMLRITKIDDKFDLTQKLEHIAYKTEQMMKQINQNLHQILNKSEEGIRKIQNILREELEAQTSSSQDTCKYQFRFSDKFKGHKFVIKNEGKVAEQTGNESSGQRLLLIQPNLPKDSKLGKKPLNWGIKVVKLAGWIAVGISLKNLIINAKYGFNYTSIGHGSYQISANGYSWSHSSKDFNSASKSFSFTTGDTIYIQYDPRDRKVRFFKNGPGNQFELEIADPPENDEYCPSVNMCSSGDSVEIVTEKPSFL